MPHSRRTALFLMVGLPGAGKTTQAKEIAASHQALRLTPDEWMIPLFDGAQPDGKRDILEGRLVTVAMQALRVGTSVVLDFGLWGRDERSSLRWLARRAGAVCQVIYLPVDRDTQRTRVAHRQATTPQETFPMTEAELDQWRVQFEEPDAAELDGDDIPDPPPGWRSWYEWAADRWPTLDAPLFRLVPRKRGVLGLAHRARHSHPGQNSYMRADEVCLRAVEDADLELFFRWQADPGVTAMAAVSARGRAEFDAHWAKIRADSSMVLRTSVADGVAAGNITSWEHDGQRLIGYLVGPGYWGRGIATRALAQFVGELTARPLYAHVAAHNAGSVRVLEKCAFRRDLALEAAAPPSDDGVEVFIFVLAS